jgi:N-acetylmuramoyl-L-alanine amidase CwlA
VEIREQLVTARDRTWEGRSACSTITVHETANVNVGANAQAHANLQSNGNVRLASWHIQVDDTEAIRSFPDEVRCWHAGRGAQDSIAVEICVNADGDYDQALANAAEVVATLRETHGLGREALRLHHDWTGKNCPSRLLASGAWQAFVASTDPVQPSTPPKVGNATGSASAGGGKSVATMAAEILAGLHGNGHDTRRRSLGISQALYEQVRAEVNRRARGAAPTPSPIRSVSVMATEVIDGKHGNGHDTRRRSLGISEALYAQVRAEVNRRLR